MMKSSCSSMQARILCYIPLLSRISSEESHVKLSAHTVRNYRNVLSRYRSANRIRPDDVLCVLQVCGLCAPHGIGIRDSENPYSDGDRTLPARLFLLS